MIKVRKSVEIVVAAYKEDLSWLDQVRHPITIYNKNDNPPVARNDATVINLPNIGRESHSYLHHIITRYDSLSDITIFTQGHPFDHCPHFIKIADCSSILKMDRIAKSYRWHEYHPNSDDFCGMSGCVNCGFGIEDDWNYQWVIPYAVLGHDIMHPAKILPREAIYCSAALLAISREYILRFSLEQYIKLQKMMEDYWSMGWAMERIWYHIYN